MLRLIKSHVTSANIKFVSNRTCSAWCTLQCCHSSMELCSVLGFSVHGVIFSENYRLLSWILTTIVLESIFNEGAWATFQCAHMTMFTQMLDIGGSAVPWSVPRWVSLTTNKFDINWFSHMIRSSLTFFLNWWVSTLIRVAKDLWLKYSMTFPGPILSLFDCLHKG